MKLAKLRLFLFIVNICNSVQAVNAETAGIFNPSPTHDSSTASYEENKDDKSTLWTFYHQYMTSTQKETSRLLEHELTDIESTDPMLKDTSTPVTPSLGITSQSTSATEQVKDIVSATANLKQSISFNLDTSMIENSEDGNQHTKTTGRVSTTNDYNKFDLSHTIAMSTWENTFSNNFQPNQRIAGGFSTSSPNFNVQLNQSTTFNDTDEDKTSAPPRHLPLGNLGGCGPFGYCANVSRLPENVQYCHCDDMCKFYDDCCTDANVTDIPEITNIPKEACVKNPSKSKANIGAYVVSQCLVKYKGMPIEGFCRSSDIIISGPWVVGSSNFIYKNHFCAECNDIFEFTPFAIKYFNFMGNVKHPHKTMSRKELFDYTIRHPNIIYKMIPPLGITLRSCVVIEQIPFSELCLNGTFSPVQKFDVDSRFWTTYKNEECLPSSMNVPPKLCIGQILGSDPTIDLITSYPMSVMFYLQRQQFCEVELGGFCLTVTKVEDVGFHWRLSLVSTALISVHSETLSDIMNVLKGIASCNSNVDPLTVHVQRSFSTPYQYSYTFKFNRQLHELTVEEAIEVQEKNITVNFKLFTSNGNVTELKTKTHENFADYTSIGLKRFEGSHIPPPDSLVYFPDMAFDNYLIICDQLDESIDNGLLIRDIIGGESETDQVDYVKDIITYTGMSISSLALGYSVFMFRKTKMHKSIPGTNVQSICISLLMSNIVFMVGIGANDYHSLCYCIGVSLHYLWLSVFSFKSISLVYISCGLESNILNRSNSVLSKFSITLIGLMIPLLFVIPSIVVDVSGVFHLCIEYSGDICFPTGFPGNIYFVSIPIGISIMINLGCMVFIWFYLKKHSFGTRMLRKSNNIHLYHILIRISFITGGFWIFGIVGGLVENDVIQYIFIIFCSFQGLFVAIGNVSTQRFVRNRDSTSGNLNRRLAVRYKKK